MKSLVNVLAATLAAFAAGSALAQEQARFEWFEYRGADPQFATRLAEGEYRNPVLAGFHPDPSIVRVGAEFYLTNSTFAWFPGLPIYHSRDLVNWRHVGNALDRRAQVSFENGQGVSRGIFAPTLRHHDGRFYIVTTDVDGIGNFIISAGRAAGPWSDPVPLPEIDGIDPDLFFDEDGQAYIAHNGPPPGEPRYDGHRAIWLWTFDLANMKVVPGSRRLLVDGGVDIATQPIWIEGPHLFRHDGWYFLNCAEGGTAEGHSQVMFRSRALDQPFEPWSGNPILTQRDLDPARPDPVTSTGHADLVQTVAGDWWAVFLGVRPYGEGFHNIGRETFLLPVQWQDGWPRILPPGQPVPLVAPRPGLQPAARPGPPQTGNFAWRDDFANAVLKADWLMLRTGERNWWKLNPARGVIEFEALAASLRDPVQPALLARRQQHRNFTASTGVVLPMADGVTAGITAFQDSAFHYFLGVRRTGTGHEVVLEETRAGEARVAARAEFTDNGPEVALQLTQIGTRMAFYYQPPGGKRTVLIEDQDATLLSTQVAGGFVGTMLGIHARTGASTGQPDDKPQEP